MGDRRKRTFCFLEDAVDGAGTAAAGHCYGEVVVVGWGGHFCGGVWGRRAGVRGEVCEVGGWDRWDRWDCRGGL